MPTEIASSSSAIHLFGRVASDFCRVAPSSPQLLSHTLSQLSRTPTLSTTVTPGFITHNPKHTDVVC